LYNFPILRYHANDKKAIFTRLRYDSRWHNGGFKNFFLARSQSVQIGKLKDAEESAEIRITDFSFLGRLTLTPATVCTVDPRFR
jgi:hypothetical protein